MLPFAFPWHKKTKMMAKGAASRRTWAIDRFVVCPPLWRGGASRTTFVVQKLFVKMQLGSRGQKSLRKLGVC